MNHSIALRRRTPVSAIPITNQLNQNQVVATCNQIRAINPFYVKTFLKRLINHLEGEGVEVNEELYELYCNLLSSRELGPTESDAVEYFIDSDRTVKICECPKLLSGFGTTGKRTWEAAPILARFLVKQCADALNGATVLELGTGTGLVGISLILYSMARQVIMTDGAFSMIENLITNLELNKISPDKVQTGRLLWGEDHFLTDTFDILVGADITYDSRAIPALVTTIKEGFKNTNCHTLYLAASIRSETTLEVWDRELKQGNWCTWQIFDPGQDEFCWHTTSPVKIYVVRKR